MAQQTDWGHMTDKEKLDFLDWEHMTDKEKLDFLYAWCHKLEATLYGRAKVIYRLDAELRKKKVEKGRRGRRGRRVRQQ
jgi:hypothetical protein